MTETASASNSKEIPPLSHPGFRRFALGNVINNVGEHAFIGIAPMILVDAFTPRAAAWYIFAVTATSLFSPALGSYADKCFWRRLYYLGLGLQALSMFCLGMLVLNNTQILFAYVFLIFTNSLGAAAYLTGWKVGLAELFPTFRRRARLTLNTLFYATAVVGPILATPFIGHHFFFGFILINTTTFLAPAIALFTYHRYTTACLDNKTNHPSFNPISTTDTSKVKHLSIKSSLKYLLKTPDLRSLFVFFLISQIVSSPFLVSLLARSYGSKPTSLLLVTGVNIFLYLGNQFISRRASFYAGTMAIPAAVFVLTGSLFFAFGPFEWTRVCATFLLALSSGIATSYYVAALVEMSPTERYGSLSGIFGLFTVFSGLLSSYMLSSLPLSGELLSLAHALVLLASVYVLVLVWHIHSVKGISRMTF